MREYRFQADEDSVEDFRRLRGAWRDVQATDRSATIRLADGSSVRVDVQQQDIEPGFAATCLTATHSSDPDAHADLPDATVHVMDDLGLGGNDVVLFTGATWLATTPVETTDNRKKGADLEAVVQQVGTPADIPNAVEAVCVTHDALVVASPVGAGCLIRIASVAGRLEVITDRAVIAAFLTLRSYAQDES